MLVWIADREEDGRWCSAGRVVGGVGKSDMRGVETEKGEFGRGGEAMLEFIVSGTWFDGAGEGTVIVVVRIAGGVEG